jgi:hypothetical protein
MQQDFADWDILSQEHARIWEPSSRLRSASEPWDTWKTWMGAYRTLVATVQVVYAAQDNQTCANHP